MKMISLILADNLDKRDMVIIFRFIFDDRLHMGSFPDADEDILVARHFK